MRYKLSPSILAAKLLDLPKTFSILNKYPVSSIHIDIMDGQFVNNLTIGPSVVAEIRQLTKIPFYGHLMILKPENLIRQFLESGIDVPIFHIEATSSHFELVELIKSNKKKAGIAINPDTPVERIYPLLNLIDVVVIMTVKPGFYGQGIIMKPLENIKYIRKINPDIEIIVDGGVKLSNLHDILKYEPTTIVSSSEIFFSSDIGKKIEEFLLHFS
ncbi:MAG: ribulose-phosphate 3-epimerase [Planctomycetota bacterium]